VRVHPTADISPEAAVGEGTVVWHHAQIRERALVGEQCVIGKDVYIDAGVVVGNRVKIQNGALLYSGVKLEDGVFIGPLACLTNDRYPRAVTPGGDLKGPDDWVQGTILVRYGASIGAGATVLAGVEIGRFAMIAAGAVVTRSVPDHALLVGAPARQVGFVCRCGRPVGKPPGPLHCQDCDWSLEPAGSGS
jgi:UDP-2-acetamido-3-amino-2,3-dideoxy-glucuronate N-acetyltransferase